VKDPILDYVRRDSTVNAMYLDEDYNVIDFSTGQEDLKKKLIRFIGDPYKRIEEDPLRIARAERFAKTLGFEIEEKTQQAIKDKRDLLGKLNPEKLKEEQRKGWKGTL
jgi:tRNA nucleotidyltransferase (CCA-adding enzyme)